MKITDIKIISFKAITRATPTKWGYGVWGEEHDDIQRIIKIETDEGAREFSRVATVTFFHRL
jgi:hypothetical protein